ncbi:hypothetical protein K439DRAFT_1648185 [Ramaria rubella]|nr:hypothetical protein K439DRAFT_1648185 [Ramaria rubella]
MRQTTQTPEDGKLRRALQNMRYKACTAADISFLKTLVGGRPAKKVKLNQARFHNISIIVGPNAHRDKYNMLGSNRYANDTKQPLHHFYSRDTLGSPKMNEDNHRNISRARVKDPQRASNVLSPELQHVMKTFSICHGMPVLVKHNIATPCCVTNGAEGTVVGWKCSRLTKDKRVLDVLFVKLKNPPVPIHLDGLPLNVVPIGWAAQDIIFDLGGCLTHQSYYTSLSRSASASGTPNKIMGGASGWLRQECRELEILDEITKLSYEKKLPTNITGDRRNTIIREYQLWKGTSFIPKHVHAALCWSNDDPFPLLEVTRDTDWYIHNGVNDRHAIEHNRSQTKKAKLYELEDLDEMPMQNTTKRQQFIQVRQENTNPLGVQWNSAKSSCAYDALIMIMHTLWKDNDNMAYNTYASHNRHWQLLHSSLQEIENGTISLERARDQLQQDFHQISNQWCIYQY